MLLAPRDYQWMRRRALTLVSYGGSSVLTMMTAMGLLISVNARRRIHS